MNIKASRLSLARLFTALALTAVGCGGGDSNAGSTANTGGGGNVSAVELGKACNATCDGTYCQSSGTSASQTCPTSDATYPCLGTTAGMYCTLTCSTDSDCSPGAQSMKCLAECAKHPEVAGLCWSASDYEFMVAGVCGTANATGTGGTSSTIGSAGGSSSRGGATGTANVAGVAGVGGSSALSAQGGALSVGGSTVAGGASNSGTSGNSSTGIGGLLNTGGNASGTTALGASCGGPCNGTFCRSSGSAISLVCTTSDASAPCIGTETGMYCTHTCSSDADCAPASRDMKCLTSCAKYSTAAGLCWSTEDFQFMSETVCGTATPSGTGGAPTSQGGSNSIGGGTGMGGLTFGTGGIFGQGGTLGVAGQLATGGAAFGGSGAGVGGATSTNETASCTGVAPCGGVLDGTWQIDSSCTDGNLAAQINAGLPAECSSMCESATISQSGTVTFANGVETPNVSTQVVLIQLYTSACLSAIDGAPITMTDSICSALQVSSTSGGTTTNATCSFSGGACLCVTISQSQTSAPIGYSASGTSITYSNGDSPTDYCVSGSQLTESQAFGTSAEVIVGLTLHRIL